MLPKISFFAFLGLSSVLGAAQPPISVSAQTLAGWTVFGADSQALAAQSDLSLPAGAQISRVFSADGLSLQITSSPQFGAVPADSPVLEIGTAALVFVQNGNTGKISLVVDDNAPVPLPFTFALDANGRSLAPLTLNFARQDGVVSVASGGQSQSFPVAPVTGSVLEIVVSAGADHDWPLDQLTVTLLANNVVVPAMNNGNGQADSTKAKSDTPTTAGAAAPPKSAGAVNGATTNGGPAAAGNARAATPAPALTLEVFTPSPIRHGRAETVRAALAGQKFN